jgi:hypothetical protein
MSRFYSSLLFAVVFSFMVGCGPEAQDKQNTSPVPPPAPEKMRKSGGGPEVPAPDAKKDTPMNR